mgnify:CR=1 FL=1
MSFSCGGGKEGPVLKKLSVCILFGGVSSEHEVSLRSAESVLNHIDKDKYNIFPVGITKDGDWILFGGKDYGMLPAGTWQNCEENRRAAISPVRGQGLLSFENDCVVRERIDVVFPVMHGENCEDGAIQGLLQIAGIPYVGPHVAASAACMDKTITKLIASQAGVRQADWQLVTREGFARSRAAVLDAVEAKFGSLLPGLKWLNFGGGHHITRPGYDLATLEACIARMQEKYGVQVYLEPGEAWALNAGYLVTTVLDTLQNGDTSLAVLDMSAACHTPDVIEMPYRPPLLDAGEPGEKPCTIRLGGPTCLAGDVVGDYSFDAPLAEGDRLIFGDMAIYTTCKNNTFNGMPLPPIWALAEDGTCRELVRFGYNDFKMRLGHRA